MNEAIAKYITDLQHEFTTGRAREHSYRPALKTLIESFDEKNTAVNEPQREECGAPDFVILRKEIPVGYIEAKDLNVDLNATEKSEQLDRYRDGLENLLLTDYLDFRFFKHGEKVAEVRLASTKGNQIVIDPDAAGKLDNLLTDFVEYHGQTIKSAPKLAKMMAGKARLMRDVILKSLDEETGKVLRNQLEAFRHILISDLKEEDFADMYAQTVAYGLFAARLHDPTLETFTRQEAAELLPKTNPFLRKLFNDIAGPDLDAGLSWIVDALADVFRATDIKKILESFNKEKGQADPFIHFYETFLGEYNPKLKKSRGVWYTPDPVVKFIVRAVDDVLKKDFGLVQGLADTSKIKIDVDAQMSDGRFKDGVKKIEKEVHKVQILDPAAGTGTFLAEVIRKIYSNFEGQQGVWDAYVNEHLLPRIHGFELLMAPYAMCHLKLDLLLTELGFKQKDEKYPERLSVYLTNSLEEAHPDTNTLWSGWLSNEASAANKVKKETPVMVVLGNPPYSGVSSNNTENANQLSNKYKIEPGGKHKLKEKKNWLNDDYVKFISFAEDQIINTGEGIVSFITNHGYIDNATFRGMRWHLLQTFDEIFIFDLHGNSLKKETSPEGGKDENVFNIKQGVAIIFAIKNGRRDKELANLYHAEIFGKRSFKFKQLNDLSFETVEWKKINYQEPDYFFFPRDYELEKKYTEGFKIDDLFSINNTGVMTSRDQLVTDSSVDQLKQRMIRAFSGNYDNEFIKRYNVKNSGGYDVVNRLTSNQYSENNIYKYAYKPFDFKFIYYDPSGFTSRPAFKVMSHLLQKENLGLIVNKNVKTKTYQQVYVTNTLVDLHILETAHASAYCFPLYLFQEDGTKSPNLDQAIWNDIKKIAGKIKPEDILDYIYASLHSPSYREKYKEFLKIDFPRVPYPENKKQFDKLVVKGRELRELHLMESPKLDKLITTYPVSGNNLVEKPRFEDGKVWINSEQHFDSVPEIAWNFYIGGYQPAQKWLKDRKGRELSFEDILHWQKIIVVLHETDIIMKEIDKV